MTFAQFKKAIPGIKRKMQGWPYKVIIVDGPQGPTGKTTAAKIRDYPSTRTGKFCTSL